MFWFLAVYREIPDPPTDVAMPAACISFSAEASQSNPSYNPSPLGAQVP